MSTPPFVHLHCHSHYSLLDGASPIDKLVARAKELGMTGLALTDHGNLHGAVEFYQTAKKAGINPILGYEAYIAPDSRFKKEVGGLKEASYHLTLLAQNQTGFKNLIKLASAAYLEGFYFKPRIDRELLAQYNEGIICLSGCVSSEFSRMLLKGQSPDKAHVEEAKQVASWFHRVFGDRYFIEIQNNGLEIQRLQMQGAVEVAREMGLPLVCTNDSHYVNREDAEAQDVLLCINTGKYRTDTNRMRMEGDQFYLRSPAEMHAAFAGYEEALKQTQTIADSVSIELDLGKRHFPTYTPPENKTPSDFLRELCIQGLRERYADKPERWSDGPKSQVSSPKSDETLSQPGTWDLGPGTMQPQLSPEVLERLDRELSVINQLGFPNYFLIVWDFVRYAREHNIPATARGSGVGALVAYALYLSHVCPLEFDLLFERFLDISRLEAPDIDIDFCKDRRGEVINYVKEKYGTDNVAQIGTFGTLAARAAIRDVGRALGIPIPQVDKIVAMVPDELGIELAEALEKSGDLRRAYDTDAQTRELLDLAMKIEGLARNLGTHAAAVVIADQPLVEYVPLCRVKDKEEVITQWSMGDVERAGLLKMDLLGLRNLTILSRAIDLIEQTTGRRVDPYKFPLDDAETYALLCRGETKGIFQLESGGIRDLLTKMKPDHFRDIIATNALYRPGPLEGGMVDDYVQVKHGRKQARYIHPLMKEVLEETHGVMVYQEQVMRILNLLGGIDLPSAYTCIKAISKKKLETIAKFEQEFIAGATQRGLKQAEAVELFEMIKKFAGYGFNKCVVADTVIVDAQTGERTTVGDLFSRRRPFAVHALDERGKLHARAVTDIVWNGRKPVFKVRTILGNELVATANHPLRTLNGWTTIDKLRSGDRIAAPRRLAISATAKRARHEIITLAHLLAEGNTCHPTCLYFYNDSKTLIDDFVAAVQQFPDMVARVDCRRDGRRSEVCVSTGRAARFQARQSHNASSNTAGIVKTPTRSGAYRWAATLGILNRRATGKCIPDGVFELADDEIALFLGRLWSGDGYVARTNQMPFYATSSLLLARDVRLLLLRLGIVSRLTTKTFKYRYKGRTSERLGYTVYIIGADSFQAFLDIVAPHIVGRDDEIARLRDYRGSIRKGFTSKDTIPADVRAWVNDERVHVGLKWRDLEAQSGVCIRELCNSKNPLKKGFRRSTIQKLAEFFDSSRLRNIAETDVFWDTVVCVEPQGIEDTYDLAVEQDHNFVADGLLVHNSHSTAYALIAYMTAYLKTHYPCEFMAALLCGDIDARNFKKKDSLVDHLEDCRRMGIEVLPPDVNSSDVAFGVRVAASPKSQVPSPKSDETPSQPGTWDLGPGTLPRSITFGLSAIKGCGAQAASALVDERNRRGPYRDIFDFCERVDPALCNRATIESLIKAGAFDFTGARRAQLLAVLDRAMQRGASLLADRKSGQKGLFDTVDDDAATTAAAVNLPDIPEWDEKEKLGYEKEVLGFYLTSHPLAEHAETLATYCTHTTASVPGLAARTEVIMGGLIGAIKHSQTKNPRQGETNTRYAMFDLEDMEGVIRCILWPSDFVNYGHMVTDSAIVALRGSIDRRPGSEEANLIINEILPLSELATRFTRGIRIRLEELASGGRKSPENAAPHNAASVGNALRGIPALPDDPSTRPLQPPAPPGGVSDALNPLPPGEGSVRGSGADDDSCQTSTRILNQLHEILRGYPGTCEVELALILADGTKLLLKSNSLRVDLTPELRSRIDDLLGPGNVKLIAAAPSSRESTPRGNGNGNGGNGRGNYARREPATNRA